MGKEVVHLEEAYSRQSDVAVKWMRTCNRPQHKNLGAWLGMSEGKRQKKKAPQFFDSPQSHTHTHTHTQQHRMSTAGLSMSDLLLHPARTHTKLLRWKKEESSKYDWKKLEYSSCWKIPPQKKIREVEKWTICATTTRASSEFSSSFSSFAAPLVLWLLVSSSSLSLSLSLSFFLSARDRTHYIVKERSCGCGWHRQIPTLLLSISLLLPQQQQPQQSQAPSSSTERRRRPVGRSHTDRAGFGPGWWARPAGRSVANRKAVLGSWMMDGWMHGWAWPVGPSLAYRQDFFFFFVHGWACCLRADECINVCMNEWMNEWILPLLRVYLFQYVAVC